MPRTNYINARDYYCVKEAESLNITGEGVRIALFDTGVDADLAHVRINKNNVRVYTDGHNVDTTFHGSKGHGILSSDRLGCEGIARGAQVYSYKILSVARRRYSEINMDSINKAVDDAIAHRVQIASFALGGYDKHDAAFEKAIRRLIDAGVKVFAATLQANEQQSRTIMGMPHGLQLSSPPVFGVGNPADVDGVIAVGMLNLPLQHELYLQIHQHDARKPQICLGATNVRVVSPCTSDKRGCELATGTSIATFIASGLYALQLEAERKGVEFTVKNPPNMAPRHHGIENYLCGGIPKPPVDGFRDADLQASAVVYEWVDANTRHSLSRRYHDDEL